MTYAAMKQYADILPHDLYIASPEWPMSGKLQEPDAVRAAKKAFFDAYQGTDAKPDGPASFAWDPTLLVVTALRRAGPDATAEQVRKTLAEMTGVAGTAGIYDFPKFPQRGLDDSNIVVTRWDAAAQNWVVVSQPKGEPLR
jgi:branched-chain amino acid transport system substrate-binding protein